MTAAVEHLARRPDIAAVGVWGFSQGGWVAPLAASRDSLMAFVVMVSGSAVSPQEQHTQALAGRLRRSGLGPDQLEAALRHQRDVWARVNAGARLAELREMSTRAEGAEWGKHLPRFGFQWELDWWRQNEIDPAGAIRALRVLVLAVFGEQDEVVLHRENAPRLAGLLAQSASRDYTIRVLPDANHQVMTGPNYHRLYFHLLTSWATRRWSGAASHED